MDRRGLDKRHDIARDLARRYGTLDKEQIGTLANLLIPMRVKKGHSVLQEGDVCEYIYYVEHGLVRQFYVKNGRELTEHIGYEGGIIMCLESLFRGVPSYLTIEALEPLSLFAIPFNEYMKLCEESFQFSRILLSILEESLIVSQQKADTLRFETAKERYLRTLQDHPDIILRSPLHIIASYLQMTPETLSRVRNQVNAETEA